MNELERLGRDARAELGAPPEAWLRSQRQRARRALEAPPNTNKRWQWTFAAVAATLLVLAGGVLTFGQFRQPPAPTATLTRAVVAGERAEQLRLADGSSIVLEARTRTRVEDRAFATQVWVEAGHATFDVAPQGSGHFTVLAGAYRIRVIGTRFSVRHEPPASVEVSVEHGIVAVTAPGREAPIRLQAGDRLRGGEHELRIELKSAAPAASASASASAASASAAPPSMPVAAGVSPAASSATPASMAAPDWEALYRERRYSEALLSAKEFGFQRLSNTLPARKLADLADAARLGGDSALALAALGAVERRFPGSPQANDAVFLIGRVHATRGESDAALARFEKYLQHGERAPYALEAMGRLVELYSGRGNTPRARATAERYLERAPNGAYRRLCLAVLQRQ